MPHRYCDVTDTDLTEWMTATMSKDNWHVLVATQSKAVLGYVIVEIRVPVSSPFIIPVKCAAIDQLAVYSSLRRKGLATRLMSAAEELARNQVCSEVQLEVLEFNQEAKVFYEGLNYEPTRWGMRKFF